MIKDRKKGKMKELVRRVKRMNSKGKDTCRWVDGRKNKRISWGNIDREDDRMIKTTNNIRVQKEENRIKT